MTTTASVARLLCCVIALATCSSAFAQEAPEGEARERRRGGGRAAYPPKMDGAEAEVYKTVGDVKLNAYVFKPPGWTASDKRPAVVFFFGGGWTGGSPAQFEPHCRHFAERGMVAVAADYRVKSRHGVSPAECVADAKSAVRWLRANAARLGVDPARVAAGGGSAGGHIAACAGVLKGFDEKGEDAAVSSRPDALVLFNPALDIARFKDRFGDRAAELSPLQHVAAGVPPTIIFHGKDDRTVPYAGIEAFAAAMAKAGNRCELVGYDGQGHGFFNHRRNAEGGGEMYRQTLEHADAFLVSLGYLEPATKP